MISCALLNVLLLACQTTALEDDDPASSFLGRCDMVEGCESRQEQERVSEVSVEKALCQNRRMENVQMRKVAEKRIQALYASAINGSQPTSFGE
jgi:hypothetical protein